jgi:thiamine biosynthesis protein ThiI
MAKLLCLISGGIDSPVAAYLMSKKHDVDYVFFYNDYMDKKEIETVKKCIKKINNSKLHLIDNTDILKEIVEKTESNLRCILCKRFMMRMAESIDGYDALVTGDSLSQVASQTLDNLILEDSAIEKPILRPLIGFDKSDIMKIADEIGTLKISEKHKGCSLAPKKPRTKGRLSEIEEEEKKIRWKQ